MMYFLNWPGGLLGQSRIMKQLLSFVKKEFYHVFRDSKTLLILFGLPIAQIVLFGFALTNEIKNARIGIGDMTRDQHSIELINKISASKYFNITTEINNEQELTSAFKKGDIKLAVMFPAGFGNDLANGESPRIQIIADATDPNTANTLINYLQNIIIEYQGSLKPENASAQLIDLQTRMIYNPELKGATNYVPGVMALVLLLVCVLMTSVSIVREKELGTMEVLLVSPVSPILVIISKAIPYFILSLVNLTVILILSVTLLDMPINGSLLLLFLESGLLILTALALGLLISNSTNSQQSAMLISLMGMLIPTMLFTGFMFPLENMPIVLQVIANIVPSKWYYIIVKSIMIKGLGISAIWKETLILAGMTVFLLSISIKKYKTRLA